MQHDKILILDFGSQVTQLIARRVREAHVFCEVHPCDVPDEWIREYAKDGKLKGVILSGSHASVWEDETDARLARCSNWASRYWASATACRPGGSWAARSKAATSANSAMPKCAPAATRACSTDIAGLRHGRRPRHAPRLDEPRRQGDRDAAWLQADGVHRICPIAGMADEERRFYGVQFHPEVTHTSRARRSSIASCWISAAPAPTG